MAKIAQNHATQPSAWIVSPKDKGRKSVKNGKIFLDNGESFEIELFNPLKECVLSDIKLNGQSISKTGLVLKPGQRFYLDCFVDDKKKFVFNTYEIEGTTESIEAAEKNGLLEVFFYKEDVITLDNWKTKFDKLIVERWYPVYYPTRYYDPWYQPTPFWYGTGNCYPCTTTNIVNTVSYPNSFTTENINGSLTSGSTYTSLGSNSIGNTQNNLRSSKSSNTIPIGSLFSSDMIETGRIEKGSSSSQKFVEIDMDFEKNYISSTILQILPSSRKPIETKDIFKESKSVDENIELIKKLADLHSAGVLTDEEFSEKKSELLSKI